MILRLALTREYVDVLTGPRKLDAFAFFGHRYVLR
jgi:hypothetical protein